MEGTGGRQGGVFGLATAALRQLRGAEGDTTGGGDAGAARGRGRVRKDPENPEPR